ncbi:MAG: molybdenum cofactor biosynthesis protein MoaE [Coriobacteriia bacterium]|nr:molybdenum cofactor biosynthesis protein MoaE [Coriobacteriia bacterium]MBN2839713.1 molybdenum cofactor biosynthesis protein MoaE [Coriobacteriia bacterium]
MSESVTPSLDAWLAEAKREVAAKDVGMYLCHNGVVRSYSRDGRPVTGMDLSVDRERLEELVGTARLMEGVSIVRVWVNEGHLEVGDDIMYVMVGGDIRPNVIEALTAFVGMIKSEVVTETEYRPEP